MTARADAALRRLGPILGSGLGVATLCAAALRLGRGAIGFDVYYYALQTRSLERSGRLLFADRSLVYPALAGLDHLVGNPVLSVQLVAAACLGILAAALAVLARRRGGGLFRYGVAVLAVLNPAGFYLGLEFTKNLFALALGSVAYCLLSGLRESRSRHRRVVRIAVGLPLLLAAAGSHRMIAGAAALAGTFAAVGTLRRFVHIHRRRSASDGVTAPYLPVGRKPASIALLVCLAACGAIIVMTFPFLRERFPTLAWNAPIHRLIQFARGSLSPGERIFYLALQLAVPLVVPWAEWRRLRHDGPSGARREEFWFAAAAWASLFPFLEFGWDEAGFRLILQTPLLLAPWLLECRPGPRLGRALGGLMFAAALAFSAEAVGGSIAAKGPDYVELAIDFRHAAELADGKRLVAHRGLAGFLWFEHGVWTENFTPEADAADGFKRIVYGFGPEILAPYCESGDAEPVVVNGLYCVVDETVWRRFYAERSGLRFMASELNPWMPRPATAFRIDPVAAAIMSPATRLAAP